MIRRTDLLIVITGVLAFLVAAAHADTITLKSSVRLAPDFTKITLADIAMLEGAEAERFADLEIAVVRDQAQVQEIAVRDVRAKLEEAGAHWGKLNLNGGAVIVRPGRNLEAATTPLAMVPIDLAPDSKPVMNQPNESDEDVASKLVIESTLRGAVANVMVNHLRVPPSDLRLAFRESDREFLATPIDGWRFEIQPQGNPGSDRIGVAVRVWQGNRVTDARSITVLPKLRRSGAKLVSDIAKDETVSPGHVAVVDVWLEPSQAAMNVSPDAAVGRVTTKSLKAGEILRESHLRRDALIRRGDLVTVRCIVGGVAISLQAEARSNGAHGELIEMRKIGERTAFTATVIARGEAIIDLSRRD